MVLPAPHGVEVDKNSLAFDVEPGGHFLAESTPFGICQVSSFTSNRMTGEKRLRATIPGLL